MKSKRFLVFLVVLIILVDLSYFYPRIEGEIYEWETVNVTRVLDGDTLETENERIRLLCINSPEQGRQGYQEAKEKLLELDGREVEILRDKTDEDKYDRKLRYVSYEGRLINKEILEEGLASLYMCEGRYGKELRGAEEKAREQEKGIWKKSEGRCRDCIHLIELNPEEEFFILKNSCSFSCQLEGKDEANHFFKISLKGREEKKIESNGNVWNNQGDSLFLRDEEGLVLYYKY